MIWGIAFHFDSARSVSIPSHSRVPLFTLLHYLEQCAFLSAFLFACVRDILVWLACKGLKEILKGKKSISLLCWKAVSYVRWMGEVVWLS